MINIVKITETIWNWWKVIANIWENEYSEDEEWIDVKPPKNRTEIILTKTLH